MADELRSKVRLVRGDVKKLLSLLDRCYGMKQTGLMIDAGQTTPNDALKDNPVWKMIPMDWTPDQREKFAHGYLLGAIHQAIADGTTLAGIILEEAK